MVLPNVLSNVNMLVCNTKFYKPGLYRLPLLMSTVPTDDALFAIKNTVCAGIMHECYITADLSCSTG